MLLALTCSETQRGPHSLVPTAKARHGLRYSTPARGRARLRTSSISD